MTAERVKLLLQRGVRTGQPESLPRQGGSTGWRLKALFEKAATVKLPEWSALALLFAVCFYAFGVLLSRLGFFQDDWHHIFQAYWYGTAGLKRFLLVDRGPFAYLVYAAFFKVLGFAPAHWHWSVMLIRFMTVAMFWLAIRQMWPGQRTLTAWLALLFAVYPIFALQPLSVAYTLHWSMYFVFMLSLFLMLYGLRHRRAHVPLMLAAVALEAVHLLCIEYFAGLELSRPIFIWLSLPDMPARERAKKTLMASVPYLVTAGLYAIYRSAYSRLYGFDRFGLLSTLTALVQSPLSSIARVVQLMVQDLVFVLLSPWYPAVDPRVLDLSRASTYLIYCSAIAVAFLAYVVVSRLHSESDESALSKLGKHIVLAGMLSTTLALFPFWVAGLSIFQKNQLWSDRLALAAMPGASMIVTGAVMMLIDRRRYRNMLLSLLVGLSMSPAVQTARSYQASWDKQQQFYWQMHWRAPALKPNTLIVSDQEILFFMGIYPTTFAVNVLYPQQKAWPEASYWFDAGTEHVSWDKFTAGQAAEFQKYTETFRATRDGVLAISFDPALDQCLWVLRPEYVDLRDMTDTAKGWLGFSDQAQIEASPERTPPPQIFGTEPAHGWCYYYEKADLARQLQQWPSILVLWKEAGQNGLRPRNSIELLPFIEAYARSGDWETAHELTTQGEALPDRSLSVLCNVWRGLGAAGPASSQRDQAASAVLAELGCQK